ncbi:MAG TPA: DNA mismatch repair protein MutS, partial [Gammaproteobacteria bacterium]|nr:DNA mismatch repair protein MutS [Gammaproteobacteria bacterium]
PEMIDGIANVHLDAVEHGDRIVFLHAVKEGPANQSYGLQVAALAGIPASVIEEAKQRLRQLEETSGQEVEQAPQEQMPLFSSHNHQPLVDALESLDPDSLTPRQALDALYHLRSLVRNG